MSEDAPDECPDTHTVLAGHVLHAIAVAYDEVTGTALRRCKHRWEAEVECDAIGVTYLIRNECPLEAVLAIAAHIVDTFDVAPDREVN